MNSQDATVPERPPEAGPEDASNARDGDAHSHVSVIDARPHHQDAWRALWDGYLEFYGTDLAPEITAYTWRRIRDPLSPVRCRLAVTASDDVVGLVHTVTHEATWVIAQTLYLEDLFVAPRARGLGVGRALIDDVIAGAKARDYSRVYWHTHSDNEAARRLYDRYVKADAFVRYRINIVGDRETG